MNLVLPAKKKKGKGLKRKLPTVDEEVEEGGPEVMYQENN